MSRFTKIPVEGGAALIVPSVITLEILEEAGKAGHLDGAALTSLASTSPEAIGKILRFAAIVPVGLEGDWSAVHPALPASPTWPDLDQPDAVEARYRILKKCEMSTIQKIVAHFTRAAKLTEREEKN